ncbi:DUF3099 domain-containing protein [Brevibacterium sp. p3-SID960]|uniref:DUF3099 domain-containing protein n=1 Tax=Brevibacterium sp. p3-SID960 TaxID=2916063 RepID=UPI0021A5AB7B|nr:DUF3099 domain-containing protein [Brevibacterium sp. p3-SID960]MCT1691466.1 DUF3099 domain-containing protein [Brevibacterium sp. p3-SID960]
MAQKRPRTHITDADESHEADTRARSRRYLLSMAIRIICFVLAIVTTGWLRWTCVAGAVFLPWVAVQIANAGKENITRTKTAQIDSPPLPELQAGRSDANAGSDPEAAGAWRAASDVADAEVIGGYTVSPGTASAPTPDGGQVGEKVPPDVVEGTVVDPDPESTQPPVREEEDGENRE